MSELPEAVVFDVDGTLCDVRGIRYLLTGADRNFHAFHRASASCPPNQWVVDAARREQAAGRAVLIVTARTAQWRNLTAMWLALHGVPSDAMWMRGERDFRPDYVVKAEILRWIRALYRPVAAYDDNPAVVRLWEQEGIPVTVVPGWEDIDLGGAP